MKIEINKKQYEVIIKALNVSSFIYGPMSDFVDDKYKKDSKNIEEMEEDLLKYAKDYNFKKNIDDFEGKIIVNEKYTDKILKELDDYDDYITCDNLAMELGRRDFRNKYNKEEIEKMFEDHGGYLGVPMFEFEKKYYDEFDKHSYQRLYIKEDLNKNKFINKEHMS